MGTYLLKMIAVPISTTISITRSDKKLDNNPNLVYFKVDYFQEDKGAYLGIHRSKVRNSISVGSGGLQQGGVDHCLWPAPDR